MIELLRRLRFAWALTCICSGGYAMAAFPAHWAFTLAVTAMMFVPLYTSLRWYVQAGLLIIGFGGVWLVIKASLDLVLLGTPLGVAVMVVGWIITPRRVRDELWLQLGRPAAR